MRKHEPITVWAWPPITFKSAKIDLVRSQPHVQNGKLQNPKGFPLWRTNPSDQGTYLKDISEYREKIAELQTDYHVVFCNACSRQLVGFFVEKGKKGRDGGILGLHYIEGNLLAYRPREDGLLGLECICGHGDTRVSDVEREREPKKYPDYVPSTDETKARFNTKKALFTATKIGG